jgi:hypothetical protein
VVENRHFLVLWVFNDEGEARKDEINVEIALKQSKDGEQAKIEHTDCAEARRTLGVMVASTANLKAKKKGTV